MCRRLQKLNDGHFPKICLQIEASLFDSPSQLLPGLAMNNRNRFQDIYLIPVTF
jgi:hypothetical protein